MPLKKRSPKKQKPLPHRAKAWFDTSFVVQYFQYNRMAPQGWSAHLLSHKGGGENMTVYEAITLMIAFGVLIAMLSNDRKK